MSHPRDSPRLLVCDTGLYSQQNDIGFITVAICGRYISKYPGLWVAVSHTLRCSISKKVSTEVTQVTRK